MMGWSNPVQGITTYQVDGIICDLISEYGKIPYEDIKTQSETYWKAAGVKKQQ